MINPSKWAGAATSLDQSKPKSGRRDFLRGFGAGAAGAAVAGMAGLGGSAALAQTGNLDVAILQFALNLEYLEAEFYSRAAFGFGLPPALLGPGAGAISGGRKVSFSNPWAAALAREIALEETKHVEFLRAALTAATGSAPSCPALNLGTSFQTLGSLAGLGSAFDPYANEIAFFIGAYVFEDVGVTAYHGAAPLITSKPYLDKAAGILATEAYHAGVIRLALFASGNGSATQAISHVRATLDGTAGTTNVDDHGVGDSQNATLVDASYALNGSLLGGFPTNNPPGNNAIAYDRTTRQVLNIVYGGVGATKGLFFPNGLNGTITS
jgi:hypothetical protein